MFQLLRNKSAKSKQSALIQSLEGIGDILVYETKRQKNTLVLEGLEKIKGSVEKIFQVQQNDPEKFEKLIGRKDFFEKGHLIGFTAPINQIMRVYEVAINSRNTEISKYCVYNIISILKNLSSKPENDEFIEQILRQLGRITRTSIKHEDVSVYAASIHWYTNIVFDSFDEKYNFLISYLDQFDRHFFSIIRHIVSENQAYLFNDLVAHLIEGIHIPDYNKGKIWEYGYILQQNFDLYKRLNLKYDIGGKVNEIANSEDDIISREKLEAWLDKFVELKNIIEENLSAEQKITARQIEKEIREFASSQFKYNNLLEIVFATGAYCLFKKRYSFIRYLWEYKQPPDSDAHWIGHDLTPHTLNEIVSLHFEKNLFKRKFDFWEGHHGNETYYKQYLLLLLVRALQSLPVDQEGRCAQAENYKLSSLHVYQLSSLEHSIDDLIKQAVSLMNDEVLFVETGLDTTRLDELFNRKLIPFLKRLKEEATDQISAKHRAGNISSAKIEKFKEDFLKNFYDKAIIRNIFLNYLQLYEDKSRKKPTTEIKQWGLSIIDDKAAFFDEWHVSFPGWGENYGRNIAAEEDTFLLNSIIESCKEIPQNDFESALNKIEKVEDIIIFATNISFWRFFERSEHFKSAWHSKTKKIDFKNFGGWYEFKGNSIPIFRISNRKSDKQILFLNKTKIGKLVQYYPLNDDDDIKSLKDIFYINIQAFSENSLLTEALIKAPPEWLKKVGDEKKQRDYLQERVRTQIFERFEYQKDDNFEGYKLTLGDQS
ncbi:MAG: hypothetical protein RIB59_04785 [Rhodospirillales bacterium]